jgi:hypothetical protein
VTIWVDGADHAEAKVGVKDFDDDAPDAGRREASSADSGYQPLSVEFTTGNQSRSATIYCCAPTEGAAYFDDGSVARLSKESTRPTSN